MKARNIFILILFLLPTLTFAGEIFGTLKKDGKPLVKQEVKITQNGKEFGKAITDENGYFSVTIKEVGPFKLEIVNAETVTPVTYSVFSNNSSNGYTLSLVKEGDTWILKKM